MATETVPICQFVQALVDEQPNWDKEIMKDVQPRDGEIAHVATGTFPSHAGVALFQDRFNQVYPNTARPWKKVSYESCVGKPCCKDYNEIGLGSTRLQYYLEEQNWSTPLMCFDQQIHVTHAVEQIEYFISKIMRPTTMGVESMWIRKRSLQWSPNNYVARTDFGQLSSRFNHIWANDANGNECFLLTSQMPDSGLTPQMLQRLVGPTVREGYLGESPYHNKKLAPLIQLVTGDHTLWDLEHLVGQSGGGGSPTIASNWRFTNFSASDDFWAYGFSGQIGDYAVRVDPFEMRFNFCGPSGDALYPYKFQLVLPYVNITSSGAGGAQGLKAVPNPDYETARYRFSRIHHKEGLAALTAESGQINAQLPYLRRDFGGQWNFVVPWNVTDENGTVVPIDNRLGNQVQALMSLQLALQPRQIQWLSWIFHMAAPACVTKYEVCGEDPCYPCGVCPQDYNSANDHCDTPDATQTWTITSDALEADYGNYKAGTWLILANSTLCNGIPVAHPAINAATVADLVVALNLNLGFLGTWSTTGGYNLTLSNSACGGDVTLEFAD